MAANNSTQINQFTRSFTNSIAYRARIDPAFELDEQGQRILEKTFEQTRGNAMQEPFFSIRQRLCSLAETYASDNSVTPYSYQCLADSHTFLNACVEQNIINKNYMTLSVGDVSMDGTPIFNASRTSLSEAMRNGISTVDAPAFHVWLTLADMTVIDLTLISLLEHRDINLYPADKTLSSEKPQAIIWRPERKGRLNYHPVLSDDDFLSRLQRPAH